MSVLRLVTEESSAEPSEPVATRSHDMQPLGRLIEARYEIRGLLGVGSFSAVYVARDVLLGADVALKVLRKERMSNVGVARLRREVAIARDIRSPHIVAVSDVGTVADETYLVMEYLEGGSLRDRIAEGPLPIEEAISTSLQMADGLRALHAAHVVHRDIKPENVLLSLTGDVKLADLGVARYLERVSSDTSPGTSPGTIVGTAAYLSPEQVTGQPADERSDLYSLGVVMFEMLTGAPPFMADSAIGTLVARLESAAADVRGIRHDTPQWLSHVVARLLERDPNRRYQSAEEVSQALIARRALVVPDWVQALRRGFLDSSVPGFFAVAAIAFTLALLFTNLSFATGVGVIASLLVSSLTCRALVARAIERGSNTTLTIAYFVAAALLAGEIGALLIAAYNPLVLIR